MTDSALPADYAALRSGAAWREVPRDVLLVTGDDAVSYLQGQCSQDVEPLAAGAAADALLLSPQGKVDAVIRVTRSGASSFVLDTDGGAGEAVRDRLLRFRLRVRVEIEPASWRCISVRGPAAGDAVASAEVTAGSPGGPAYSLPVTGPGGSGIDLLGPDPDPPVPFGWVGPTAIPCGPAAWEAMRIETGLPVVGREVTPATIPAEAGLVDRTVSFTKGCFTGQELVARLDSRGSNVARRLCGVVLDTSAGESDASALVVAPVLTVDGEHELGSVSSAAWSPGLGRVVGLATLHRRVSPPVPVAVETPGGRVAAEARPLPLLA